jgi:hypothetical protein
MIENKFTIFSPSLQGKTDINNAKIKTIKKKVK